VCEVSQDRFEEWDKLGTGFLFESGKGTTSSLLNLFVGIENGLEELTSAKANKGITHALHGRNKVLLLVSSGGNDPARVSSQSPTCDGPDESLLVLQSVNEPGDELGKMWGEGVDTA
jgi:hypothetical protein